MIPLEPIWPAPPELTAFVASHPGAGPAEWNSPDFQVAKAAVKMRRNADQGGLCIDCERTMGGAAGHVEHIHPKAGPSGDPTRTFDYANLAQSCNGDAGGIENRHCGQRKGHGVLLVPPGVGCNDPFLLMTDGEIVADIPPGSPRKRRHELEVQLSQLGLNEPALKRQRELWVETVEQVLREDAAALDGFLSDKHSAMSSRDFES